MNQDKKTIPNLFQRSNEEKKMWHQKLHKKSRKELRERIFICLQKLISESTNIRLMNYEKEFLFRLCSKLELFFYQVSPSFEVYNDKRTLYSRLRTLITRLVGKVEAKDLRVKRSVFSFQRSQALRRKLGNEKYQEAVKLVMEIKSIRQRYYELVSRIRPCCSLAKKWPNTRREQRNNDIHILGMSKHNPQSSQLSQEVFSIYFRTRLVETMSIVTDCKTTSLQMWRVDGFEWNKLIEEAKFSLQEMKIFLR
jgi:hypothetical protein